MATSQHNSARSTREAPSGVRLELIKEEKVFIEGYDTEKLVGQHAHNAHGEYVFVLWQKLLESRQTFPMDTTVFNQIDEEVEYIYVIDKRNKDLYKFDYSAYEDAERIDHRGDEQRVPPRWDMVDLWEKCADNCLRGIYD